MSPDSPRLPEDTAREVWLRAARLQAEAAEERSRALTVPGDDLDEGGVAPEEIRAAALEAGISPEFVDLALAEQAGTLSTGTGLSPWLDRSATSLLGESRNQLEFARTIPAEPARVLEVLQAVVRGRPYFLRLWDTVGDDVLAGAILVFRTPGMVEAGSSTFAQLMAWVDLKEVRISLHPVPPGPGEEGGGDGGTTSTRLRLAVPLGRSRKINWMAGVTVTGVFSLIGGGVALGIAGATGLLLPGAMAALGVGALGTGGLTSWGMGAMYRYALGKASEEFEALVKTVAMGCTLGTGFLPRGDEGPVKEGGEGLEFLGL